MFGASRRGTLCFGLPDGPQLLPKCFKKVTNRPEHPASTIEREHVCSYKCWAASVLLRKPRLHEVDVPSVRSPSLQEDITYMIHGKRMNCKAALAANICSPNISPREVEGVGGKVVRGKHGGGEAEEDKEERQRRGRRRGQGGCNRVRRREQRKDGEEKEQGWERKRRGWKRRGGGLAGRRTGRHRGLGRKGEEGRRGEGVQHSHRSLQSFLNGMKAAWSPKALSVIHPPEGWKQFGTSFQNAR